MSLRVDVPLIVMLAGCMAFAADAPKPKAGQRTVRVSQLQSVVDEIKRAAEAESAEVVVTWEIRTP